MRYVQYHSCNSALIEEITEELLFLNMRLIYGKKYWEVLLSTWNNEILECGKIIGRHVEAGGICNNQQPEKYGQLN